MTRDEWDQVEERLKVQHAPVLLDCDGHLVALMLQRVGGMKLGITVHIDGWFKGEWFSRDQKSGEWPDIARRFFQLRTQSVYRPSEVRKFERKHGKKRTRELNLYAKSEYRMPYWTSARSLRRHLSRENAEIRWLDREEYKRRLDERRAVETEA